MKSKTLTRAQLRAGRALVEMSVRDLADKTGVHRNTISAFETGKTEPNASTVDVLRRAIEQAGVILVDENGEGPGVRLRKGHSDEGKRPDQLNAGNDD